MAATQKSMAELLAEVERLQAALGVSEKARTDAEVSALMAAQASPYTGGTEEQATGKTIKVKKCVNPWVALAKDDKAEAVYKYITVDMPTYFYRLDLPAGAINLSTNGVEFYHGQTYELSYDTLIDIKSRVARCWDHEKSIHGQNENMFRKPSQPHLISAAARAAGVH